MALVPTTFVWTDEKGTCYECGSPALFCLPEAYWNKDEKPDGLTFPDDLTNHNLRCPVCAANAAAFDGERIVGLFWDDADPQPSPEDFIIANAYPMED
jgi:hypothetical protein